MNPIITQFLIANPHLRLSVRAYGDNGFEVSIQHLYDRRIARRDAYPIVVVDTLPLTAVIDKLAEIIG